MPFATKTHPLGWSDTELHFLIGQGLGLSDLYRAMGYSLKPGNTVPRSFRERAEGLGYVRKLDNK